MSDGPSGAAPVAVGGARIGGAVPRVKVSQHGDFTVGDLALGNAGFQDCAVSDGKGLVALHPGEPHTSRALDVPGMPGLTASTGCRPSVDPWPAIPWSWPPPGRTRLRALR